MKKPEITNPKTIKRLIYPMGLTKFMMLSTSSESNAGCMCTNSGKILDKASLTNIGISKFKNINTKVNNIAKNTISFGLVCLFIGY